MALTRYRDQGDLESWLGRVTVRLALMRLRSERRRQSAAMNAPFVPSSHAERDPPLADRIAAAVQSLPEAQLAVFVLRMGGPAFSVVDVEDLPDFYPPFRAGQMKADPACSLWLLPATSRAEADGLLYDVVNRDGVITERIRVPAGRVLAGFGVKGQLYLRNVVIKGDERLELARVNR